MHKSKLGGFIIDCNTGDLQAAGAFWSGALGMRREREPGEEAYVGLAVSPNRARSAPR